MTLWLVLIGQCPQALVVRPSLTARSLLKPSPNTVNERPHLIVLTTCTEPIKISFVSEIFYNGGGGVVWS